MPDQVRYEKLPDSEVASLEITNTQIPWKKSLAGPLMQGLRWVAVIVTGIWIGYFVSSMTSWRRSPNNQAFTSTDCGHTPDQARAVGCIYEPMLRSWVPPECYFDEPREEYDIFHDRLWFLDDDLTIEADIEKLESGDELLAYTRYWHDEHCTYELRKLALAVEGRHKLIHSRAANIEHSNHCAQMIAKRIVNSYNESFLATDETITESILSFDICVPLFL
jgi:hypothetical protein